MSTTSPPPPEGPSGPEYLEQGGGDPVAPSSSSSGGRGRRTTLLAGGALVLLTAAGAGTWAAMSLLGSDAQPAEALPAGTLAYATVDLDPSGAQKIAALRMIGKFPAIQAELGGFDAQDDIRRAIFEQADCEGMSYDDDVAPWIGTSLAVAAVDVGKEEPSPVGVLELADAEAAEAGLAKLAGCGEAGSGSGTGYVVAGDWAVVAETEDIAREVVDDAADGTLADDSTYQDWMDRVGEPGVVSMYASPDVGPLVADEVAEGSLVAGDFEGAAGTVRFADGGLEVEFAASVPEEVTMALPPTEDATADVVGTLPADTAVAYGAALPEGWTEAMLEALSSSGIPQDQIDQGLAQAEAQTGLSLPEDVETLLGEQFALAVGGSFDLEQLVNSGDPLGLPLGAKIRGDAEAINGVMDRLGTSSGMPEWFETETGGDTVSWSLDPDYRQTLAGDGGLGTSESFQGVLPDADRASSLLFVDFDAGNWLTSLGKGDPEVQDNLRPLSALGISVWREDSTSHGRLRLTTD